MAESETRVPDDLRYTEQHEWISLDGDLGTIGITDYAQSELGDIVFVELPQVGDTLEKGQAFGTVEAVKTVEELYSPVSCQILGGQRDPRGQRRAGERRPLRRRLAHQGPSRRPGGDRRPAGTFRVRRFHRKRLSPAPVPPLTMCADSP